MTASGSFRITPLFVRLSHEATQSPAGIRRAVALFR
jgi:hypothetical protein